MFGSAKLTSLEDLHWTVKYEWSCPVVVAATQTHLIMVVNRIFKTKKILKSDILIKKLHPMNSHIKDLFKYHLLHTEGTEGNS